MKCYHPFILNTFISIAIVDPKFLAIINVVIPVAIMLVKLACCAGADLSSVDTLFAEEHAKKLRLNGHHSSLKPDPVILFMPKVNSYHLDTLTLYLTTFFQLSKLRKGSRAPGMAVDALP